MVLQEGGMLAFLCLLSLHYSHSSSLTVPLLSWSNSNRIEQVPVVTYGQTNELSGIYNKYIAPAIESKSLVLLFLQDELSNDDFTKYSSSFPHLQKVMETKKYIYFPSVSKEKSINELMSATAKGVEYVDSSSLGDWKYDDVNNVVVLNLEPVSGSSSEGRGEILKRNDHIMHRIIKTLKEEGKDFHVVYTAEEPSQMVANFLLDEKIAEVGFGSRHLLADNDNDTLHVFNNTCVLMYATSIKYSSPSMDDGNVTEFIAPGKWKVGGCGSHHLGCSLSLEKIGNFSGFNNATIFMDFKNDTQEWHCDIIHFSGHYKDKLFYTTFNCGGNGSTGFMSAVYDTVRAPIGMSFACHELTFIHNGTEKLTLGGFQVQTFCDGKGMSSQFSNAYNCVGFFTIPILTGIFVTVILMMGLYGGIMMMMAIQVQDRYDDPKGKTINSVPTHNE